MTTPKYHIDPDVTMQYANKIRAIEDKYPGTPDPSRDTEMTKKYGYPCHASTFTEGEKIDLNNAIHDLGVEMGNDLRIPEDVEMLWGVEVIRGE